MAAVNGTGNGTAAIIGGIVSIRGPVNKRSPVVKEDGLTGAVVERRKASVAFP